MAIQVFWQDEQKNLIRCTVSGRWTWDDLQTALNQTIKMMDSVNHKVNFMIDLRNGSFVINPLSLLGQTRNFVTSETHRNEGVKVVIGATGLVQTAYDGYRRLTSATGKNQVFHFADSEAQAHQIIAREQ